METSVKRNIKYTKGYKREQRYLSSATLPASRWSHRSPNRWRSTDNWLAYGSYGDFFPHDLNSGSTRTSLGCGVR